MYVDKQSIYNHFQIKSIKMKRKEEKPDLQQQDPRLSLVALWERQQNLHR